MTYMHVVITGAAGFLGQRIVSSLAERGTIGNSAGEQVPIGGFTLIDVADPQFAPPNSQTQIGDISDAQFLAKAVPAETTHVIHLAAVVSGQAEADFGLGMKINVDATRALVEHLAAQGQRPRVVFPSSVAVFGHAPPTIEDDTATLPISSYGAQKAMSELLINDMSRKGYIDGLSVRVPTVIVRPGKPNAAASSFASSIVREPMAGEQATCPVPKDLTMWVSSPETVCKNLIHAAGLATEEIGFPRMINLPGLSVQITEIIDAAGRAGIDTGLIQHEKNASIEAIVCTWPERKNTVRANALGFKGDVDIDRIVQEYQRYALG